MDINAIVYSLYCEYTGRRGTILDTACLAKANSVNLKDDEKVYALINVVKSYVFAGFVPEYEDIKAKRIKLINAEKEEIIIDLATFTTKRDYAGILLRALARQVKYKTATDKMSAMYQDLKTFYDNGKEFMSMLNQMLSAKDVDTNMLMVARLRLKEFLDQYAKDIERDSYNDNMINVVVSEVTEDIDEILDKKED